MRETWSAGDEFTADKMNDSQKENREEFTAGENITIRDALYLKASDGKVYKADASYSDERSASFIGFATETKSASGTLEVDIAGIMSGFSGLSEGSEYYLSNSAGGIGTTAGDNEKIVGIAVSATEILIKNPHSAALTEKAQTISGVKTFGSIPVGPNSDPTSDNQLARKSYVDDLFAGNIVLTETLVVDGVNYTDDTWNTIDLSGTIGTNEAVVLLKVTSEPGNNESIGLKFREYNDTDVKSDGAGVSNISFLNDPSGGYVIVKSNPDGKIEAYVENSYGLNVNISIVAYIK